MADKPKVLRVAILQGKKLVQERLIEAGQPVTVGTSAKNTFVFPETHLPSKQFVLFRPLKGRTYGLHFTDQMANKSSKLKAGGQGTHLGLLKDDPIVKSKGSLHMLPLTTQDKGKVVIEKGKIAVLFQFVDEPAKEAVRPLRAMDFRPRFFEDDDPIFLGFLAIWSALAVVFVIWTVNTEVVEYELEEIPDRFRKLVLEKEKPKDKPETKTKEKIDPNKDGKGKKAEKAKKAKKRKRSKNKVDEARRKEALKKSIAKRSKLLNIGVIGTLGESNSFADTVWNPNSGIANLDAALAESGGVTLNSEEALRSGTGTNAGTQDIGDLGAIGGGDADYESVKSVQVVAKVESDNTEDLSGFEGDKGTVKKTVRRYNGQLKYCYEQRLKVNPNLGGRVVIAWTVLNQRVSDVFVESNQTGDAQLAQCLVGKIKKWRFPEGVEGDVSWPFVFRASN